MFLNTVRSVLRPFTYDASCAVPGGPTGKRHVRRGGTERDGDRYACESGVSAHRSERISIRNPPSCSDMAFHLLEDNGGKITYFFNLFVFTSHIILMKLILTTLMTGIFSGP